jgi:hypothetical protein
VPVKAVAALPFPFIRRVQICQLEAEYLTLTPPYGPAATTRRPTMLTLLRRYWNELVSYDGGFTLLMMDGLLAVPLMMAAFFYPLEVLAIVAVLAVVTVAGYEARKVWRKRHPTHI